MLYQEDSFKPKPINACIYCGATEGLTIEHVVPFSLGGNLTIPNGSCRPCADITGKFEQTVARSMLGNFRVKTGAPTRNRDKRPSQLALRIMNGETEDRLKLDPEEHPGSFVLPQLRPPRVASGLLGAHATLHQPMGVWGYPTAEEFEKRLPELPREASFHYGQLRMDAFTRILAKIAYCHFVYAFGSGVTKPLLLPLILGKTREYANYIGGSDRSNDALSLEAKTSFVAALAGVVKHYGTWFHVVTIHLFPALKGPAYDVLVGTCIDQSASMPAKLPGAPGLT